MIIHDSFQFPHIHGPLMESPPELEIQIGRFAGLRGESHLIGGPYGRELSCEYTLSNFPTELHLEDALYQIYVVTGALVGTLTFITFDVTIFHNACTFLGFFEQPGARFRDGSGAHGWTTSGLLRWRQRSVFGS